MTPDRFAEPVTHPSGVRWEPTQYRPLSDEARDTYEQFANSDEGKPR